MFQKLTTCALLAGLITGTLMTALHMVLTVPLILQAETYETAGNAAPTGVAPAVYDGSSSFEFVHAHTAEAMDAGEHHGDAWKPADGIERTLFTLLATTVSTVGFGLILVAAAALLGIDLTPKNGLILGIGGFAATGLATSLGLAPELPGAAAGDLVTRQLWWVATSGLTFSGLAMIALRSKVWLKAAGVALLLAPQLIGAPHPHEYSSTVPAELAALFAARSIVLQAVLWIVLGLMCGRVWQWLDSSARATAPNRKMAI